MAVAETFMPFGSLAPPDCGYRPLAIGYWLLAIGYWLFARSALVTKRVRDIRAGRGIELVD